jgi:endonuclease/exonuclease/phosphatase (EEP) superfamily protein YafD
LSEADEVATEQEPEVANDRPSQAGRVAFLLLTVCPLAVLILATLIRLTVRDRVPYAATIFYATPPPLLVVLALFVGLRLRRLKWIRVARVVGIAGTIQFVVWGWVAFRGEQPEPPDDSMRIVFWNVSRGDFGYEDVAKQIASFDADIVTMTESIGRGQAPDFWRSSCPDYTPLPLSSGMTLLVRGDAELVEHDRAGPVCRWRVADVSVRGQSLQVAVVDFTSNPILFRRPGFDALGELFERRGDGPLILAGDFNTPIDSAVAGRLRQQATNAFEQSGHGFRETWPVFLPLMKLDQLWGNRQIRWHRCRQLWSLHSDHRPVVAEFAIEPSHADRK